MTKRGMLERRGPRHSELRTRFRLTQRVARSVCDSGASRLSGYAIQLRAGGKECQSRWSRRRRDVDVDRRRANTHTSSLRAQTPACYRMPASTLPVSVSQSVSAINPNVLQVIVLRSGWRRGVVVSGDRRMNEVNLRRARLIPGWVTVFGRVYHLRM